MNVPGKITCKEAHVLLSERQDRELSSWDTLRLRAHLAICDACSKVEKQMDFLREAIRRLGS